MHFPDLAREKTDGAHQLKPSDHFASVWLSLSLLGVIKGCQSINQSVAPYRLTVATLSNVFHILACGYIFESYCILCKHSLSSHIVNIINYYQWPATPSVIDHIIQLKRDSQTYSDSIQKSCRGGQPSTFGDIAPHQTKTTLPPVHHPARLPRCPSITINHRNINSHYNICAKFFRGRGPSQYRADQQSPVSQWKTNTFQVIH